MDIRMLAVDVDGTITTRDRRLYLPAVEALRRVEERGVRVALATGNIIAVAHSLMRYLGTSGPCIAENGGVIYWEGELHQTGDISEPKRAFEHLKTKMDVQELITNIGRLTEVAIAHNVPVSEVAEVLRDFDVEVVGTGFAIHIMPKGINKLEGIKRAVELMGISTDQVAAVGDSMNDYHMVAGCGLGATLGHSPEELKDAADVVSSLSYGAGFVDVLRTIGLV